MSTPTLAERIETINGMIANVERHLRDLYDVDESKPQGFVHGWPQHNMYLNESNTVAMSVLRARVYQRGERYQHARNGKGEWAILVPFHNALKAEIKSQEDLVTWMVGTLQDMEQENAA